MVKKLLLAVLLGTFFSGLRGVEESDVHDIMEQLLRRVNLVLFLLEQNTVRMERYGLHELQCAVNVVPTDLSCEHCVFKIDLTEKNSSSFACTMCWDQNQLDRIKVIIDNKKAHFLSLEKIISPTVRLEDFEMICFNCGVDFSEMHEEDSSSKSMLNIMIPASDEKMAVQLVFDGKIDAACGLFVQNEMFQDVMLSGKITKKEALDRGVLVNDAENAEVVADVEDTAVIDDAEGVEGVATSSSVFAKIKSGFFSSLGYIKKIFNAPWQKVLGYSKS